MNPESPRRAAPPAADDSDPAATPRRRRHWGRRVLAALVALLVVLAVAGYGFYRHLNANITHYDLPSGIQGASGSASAAAPVEGLPKGVAQNIVVIGTDSRQSAEDCAIGGSCGSAKLDGDTNADVEMIVHISADHSWITVVSIPRDTLVDIPACEGNGKSRQAGRGMVNGTLNYGIDCTLRTLHQLTGLPITHFAMVDFSGVIALSNAVGGVEVCVDDNVYDPQSHLKLARGNHTLQGMSALQFLRTRHGFGDGSDLGRTVSQHLFLASLQRKLESAGTLLNPQKVYRLAEAGTRSLTVDTGLADVSRLTQLAVTVGRIPASSTTFLTIPTEQAPEDPNRVVPTARAQEIFAKLAADQPLVKAPKAKASADGSSSASGTASTSASSSASSSPTVTETSAAGTASASSDLAHDGSAQVSSEAKGCAKVSQQNTVELEVNGVKTPMTPARAFELSPGVEVSAP